MGKWLKCGMVLGSKQQQTIQRDPLSRQLPRGASTGIDGNEAYTFFRRGESFGECGCKATNSSYKM